MELLLGGAAILACAPQRYQRTTIARPDNRCHLRIAGNLHDLNWPHQAIIEVVQGEQLGSLSRLVAEFLPNLAAHQGLGNTYMR
jgi:hypothetical protein